MRIHIGLLGVTGTILGVTTAAGAAAGGRYASVICAPVHLGC